MKSKKQIEEPPKKVSSSKLGLDLKSKIKIGKINIVNPKNLRNGFYCSICDVLRHDSSSYQSHLTSKAHMKKIGKDLSIEKSTLAQVQDRLKGIKPNNNKKENPAVPKKPKVSKDQTETRQMTEEEEQMFKTMGFANFM